MSLRQVLRSFILETTWLQTEFLAAASGPQARPKQLICEMAVIRLHDTWTRFCREIVILSASGTVTLGGTILPPAAGITNYSMVVPVLLSKYKKRRYEPKWGTAVECIDAAQRLSISNLATVSGALGATNSPDDTIRRVRNFYDHRGNETAQEASATGLFSNPSHPVVFELTVYKPGGETVLESWVSELKNIAIAAIQ